MKPTVNSTIVESIETLGLPKETRITAYKAGPKMEEKRVKIS
jgi:hypothetical protein